MTRALAAVVFLLLALPAVAQDAAELARNQAIAETDARLDAIKANIETGRAGDVRAAEDELRRLLRGSRERLGPVNRAIADVQESLGRLGPAPKEGEPPESDPIAARRQTLGARLSLLQGQRTRILANIDDAGALLGELSARRLALVYSEVMKRESTMLSPSLWRASVASAEATTAKIGAYFDDWRRQRADGAGVVAGLAALAAAFLLSFLMVGPVHYWMKRTFTRRIAKLEPTPGRRVAVAGVKMTARLLSGLVGGFAVLATARAVGLLGPEGEAVARAIWFALIAFLLVEGFTGGLFSPAAPGWRIADIEAVRGRRASALLLAIVIVFGAKSVFSAIAAAAHADAALLTLFDGVSAVLIGALLLLLCRRSLWKHEPAPAADAGGPAQLGAAPAEEGEDAPVDPWPLVRRAGRVLAIVIIGAALTGYVALADFAASRFYYLALILAVAWFARAALKEAGAFAERRLRAERAQKQPDEDKNIARFWIGAGVDLILLAAITPVILVLVGLGWQSVRDMVMRAFIGFRVGGVTISLADMFWAIAVFFLILTGTRIVQSWLQRGPFAHSRLDIGVQNSLTTLLGYVGLLIAVITGVTALGFNLANLALIAGALGVGIGFGLQGIVNNFVSGLILLFERPVKVGDWIVTASGEGTVKKISVRSTEIETFDRATIIVPNSELISQTVTNWTHKDKIGRVTVSVGVSYGSDPEQVRDILLKCARDHRLVVRYPEPFVVWKDFGASSLDFEVRCYLRDILDGLTVRTELRLAIFKAFKEAGIEIPFPQRDLHIKSMPNGAAAPTPRPAEKAAEPPPAPSETEIAEDE